MKKILALLLIFSGLFLLAGCIEESKPTATAITPIPTETDEHTLTVLVYDIHDELRFEQVIVFLEDDIRTTLELIEDHMEIIYATFEGLGVFIYGVGGFFPTEYNVSYNYWLSIYVDGAASEVGIDQIEPKDGMTLTFKESSFLDPIDLMVDQIIYQFLKDHFDTYVNRSYIHPDVLAAVSKLHLMGYEVPDFMAWMEPEINDYVQTLASETAAQLFKKIIIEKVFGYEIDATLLMIESLEPSNVYDAITVLNSLFIGNSQSEQIGHLIHHLLTTVPNFFDPDYVGMFLQAMSPYANDEDVSEVIEIYKEYLMESQTAEGIESWGSSNAASTAMVILGLIAQGINPRSEDFTVDDIDLIEALVGFYTKEGFKWLLTSEQPDLLFSTPQAFSALVTYKIYRDIWGNPPVYLYDIINIQQQN